MSLWHIAWSYLWNRKLITALTILSVALGVGLITSVLTLREETRKRFEEEGQAFDIVVGGKAGSPLQLVLSSVYFMDNSTGNISKAEYEKIKADTEYVEAAFPINLGDSYNGFRIAGTTVDLFDHKWVSFSTGEERHPFNIVEGRQFEGSMEAVIGAFVARETGLKTGDQFVSMHGTIEVPEELQLFDHGEHPYTVTGIMAPSNSPYDRVIFCNLESVWLAHEGHEEGEDAEDPSQEVTAVLVQLQSPGLRWQFKEKVLNEYKAMAAIPIEEIRKLYDNLLGTAKTVLLAIGYMVVVISALSIMIGLYLSILQRKRDLAIMRALGASAYEIFGAVIIEAFWVTMLGIGSGWVLGNAATFVMGHFLAQRYGLVISTFGMSSEQITAFATVALVGLFAGVLPAWQAYDSDVAQDLSER